jgi:hypothetical protein
MKNTSLFRLLALSSLLFTACEDDPQAEQPTTTDKCASSQYRDAKGQCVGTRNDTNPAAAGANRTTADAAAAETARRLEAARQECAQRTGYEWNSITNNCDPKQTTQQTFQPTIQQQVQKGTFTNPTYAQDSLRIECENRGFGYVWDYQSGQCYQGNGTSNDEMFRCNSTMGMYWSYNVGRCVEQGTEYSNVINRCNSQAGYQWSTRYSRCIQAVAGSTGSEFRLRAQRDTFLISLASERNCFIPRGTEILIDNPAVTFTSNQAQATIRPKAMTQGQCPTGDWNIILDHF